MVDPRPSDEEPLLMETLRAALSFLKGLPTDPARPAGAEGLAAAWDAELQEEGFGGGRALEELVELCLGAGLRSAGPRYFHYVVGGVTPAALGGDWLASTFDQVAASWVGSPAAARLEEVTLRWLAELLDLPTAWTGVLVSGAHQANLTCLAAARHWWGTQHGVNVQEAGLAGLPAMPVMASGYVHASIEKALVQLGLGRRCLQRLGGGRTTQNAGPLDLDALGAALDAHPGRPSVLVLSAGEVNSGDFDPMARALELVQGHPVWVHVDGAFGLCTRSVPRLRKWTAGIAAVQSATVDAHKWLNVPTGCGAAFVADKRALAAPHRLRGGYLPPASEPRTVFANLGPEMSRPARAFALWAGLAAYGKSGVRGWVERHVALAHSLGEWLGGHGSFELLAPVVSNVVCFRLRPRGVAGKELDGLNRRLIEALASSGTLEVGSTRLRGQVGLRVAFVNWRTEASDVAVLQSELDRLARGSDLGGV